MLDKNPEYWTLLLKTWNTLKEKKISFRGATYDYGSDIESLRWIEIK